MKISKTHHITKKGSVKKNPSRNKKLELIKLAVKKFSYTNDAVRAGYILPNGRMLDMWEEKPVIGINGYVNHNKIDKVVDEVSTYNYYKSKKNQIGWTWNKVKYFIWMTKSIRIHIRGRSLNLELAANPTRQQRDIIRMAYTKISRMPKKFEGDKEINVDYNTFVKIGNFWEGVSQGRSFKNIREFERFDYDTFINKVVEDRKRFIGTPAGFDIKLRFQPW